MSKPPARDSKWVKLALVAGSLLVTFVVLAAVGEGFLRYRERHRSEAPGTMPLLFYRHGRLHHAFVRNSDYFGWVHVNAQGFRGSRPTPLDPGGTFRIMAVGASTTADSFVSGDERAWPAQLEAWLAGRTARPVEVINAGVPGYVLLDNLIRLQTELFRFHPSLILLYHGHNELFAALHRAVLPAVPDSDTPDEIEPIGPIRYWLSRHSMLYGKLLGKWLGIQWVRRGQREGAAAPLTPARWEAVLEKGAAEYEQDLDAFLAVAASHGLRVALVETIHVTAPDAARETDPELAAEWHATVPMASTEVVLEGYRRYNRVLHEVAERRHVPIVAAAGFGVTGARFYAPGDPIHFDDAGAARMAERIGEALLAQGLVPGPGPGATATP